MFATLKVARGNDAGREYELAGEEVVLGRGRECRVVIDDVLASRRHARLVSQNDAYAVEDLQSTNHTFVNGLEIEGLQPLCDKDLIRIGDTHLVFSTSAPAAVEREQDDFSTVLNSVDASPDTETMFRENPGAKLRAILQINRALGQTLDLDVLLDSMLGGLFEIFPQASRALVLLKDARRLVPRAVKHRDTDEEGSVQYSRTIVTRVMDERQAILSQDAVHDARFSATQSVVNLQIRSVMCVPLLPHGKQPLGVIQLETQERGARFEASDVEILASVAAQVSVFIEYARLHDDILRQSRLQRELELAEQVQQDFLPKATLDVPGYQFWAYYLAAGKVGGDFYDFLTLPDENQVALLADVSGKGVPAALRMAKASTVCKVALLSHPQDLAQAVAAMNRAICGTAGRGGFITLALCRINPQTHELTVANAGHPSPLLRRADGSIEELAGHDQSGLPLGVVEDQDYPTSTVVMNPGDVVVVYSDGISEAANTEGALYSAGRVRNVMAAEKGRPPAETGKALVNSVRRYVGDREQTDDISLVVFGRSADDQG